MKFHHIGVACKNIKDEIEKISLIHNIIEISEILSDSKQHAELCLLKTKEGILIELVSGEQVKNLIKKGVTYYHLCFETENINSEIARLQNLGSLLVSEPKDAILFDYKKIAFMQVSYGLIELLEI